MAEQNLLNFITTPNCALDRSKFLCLYVPGFQRQVLKYVPRFKWIPQTKSPHSYTCNVNFVGTFVLLRIPQQANIASCSGLGNCKWIPQNVSRIRKCKWVPQTVSGFRIFFSPPCSTFQPPVVLLELTSTIRILFARIGI